MIDPTVMTPAVKEEVVRVLQLRKVPKDDPPVYVDTFMRFDTMLPEDIVLQFRKVPRLDPPV